MIDKKKNIIQCISDEFWFLKAATSWEIPIEGYKDEDQILRICMEEWDNVKQFKQVQKHYSYKIVVEYDPKKIPCEDIERVSLKVRF